MGRFYVVSLSWWTVASKTPAMLLRTGGPGVVMTTVCGVQLQQEIGKEVRDLCYTDLLLDP